VGGGLPLGDEEVVLGEGDVLEVGGEGFQGEREGALGWPQLG